MYPSASKRIQTHPNVSQRIPMHPNPSENVQKCPKFCEKQRKPNAFDFEWHDLYLVLHYWLAKGGGPDIARCMVENSMTMHHKSNVQRRKTIFQSLFKFTGFNEEEIAFALEPADVYSKAMGIKWSQSNPHSDKTCHTCLHMPSTAVFPWGPETPCCPCTVCYRPVCSKCRENCCTCGRLACHGCGHFVKFEDRSKGKNEVDVFGKPVTRVICNECEHASGDTCNPRKPTYGFGRFVPF